MPQGTETALPGATYNDRVVRQFALMTIVWGVVGMAVGVLLAAQLIWPALNFEAAAAALSDEPPAPDRPP